MKKWFALVIVLLTGLLMCGCEDILNSDSTDEAADNTTAGADEWKLASDNTVIDGDICIPSDGLESEESKLADVQSRDIGIAKRSTRGTLSASVSGYNAPYYIYVGGAYVGRNRFVISLAPGYYTVHIYNKNWRLVKKTSTRIIAGKTSLLRYSGVN